MPNRRRSRKQKKNSKRTRTRNQAKTRRSVKRPATAKQYFSLSRKDQETWDSVAHVISKIRDGMPLKKASREFNIAPRIVIERGRPALRKLKGRYVATKTDRLLRIITILVAKGKKEIATRDSRQASLVGGHWAAVQKYLQTGDDEALLKFKGKSIVDASGKRYRLLTNLEKLNRLASAGVLSFESIYAGGLR
jgi:hypothetical protein